MKKLKTRNHKYYGWTPDIPDQRDLILSLPKKMKKLPTKVDLRKEQIPIFNQGALGSCTGNAISAAYIYNLLKQNENIFIPSRLFIYYNARVAIGTANQDSGAMLRDGIKSLNSVGVCDEKIWPYTISAFTKKPLDKCYNDAKRNKAIVYQRVPRNLYDFKNCLASGLPFVGGFAVYESFESGEIAKTGKMSMPKQDEQFMGGHAILVVGYDDDMKCFIVRNSWGSDWGDKGYFYMPYEYLLNDNLSDDFWVIQQVTDPDIVITDVNIYNKKRSIMEDVKSWIQSKTIWAILIALAPFLTIKLGFDVNQTLADILQVAGLVGAIIFRVTATKKIGV